MQAGFHKLGKAKMTHDHIHAQIGRMQSQVGWVGSDSFLGERGREREREIDL